MFTSEHILLESDTREVPELEAARTVHARLRVDGALRRRAIELYLMDYYYLAVRTGQGRSRKKEWVLDLRFVDPTLQLSTHVPWRGIGAALALIVVGAAALWHIASSGTPWREHAWTPAAAVLAGLAVCAAILCVYRTRMTLRLQTFYGRAKVLEVSGGLGTFGPIRRFASKLAAHLRLAIAARRPARARHLRDEMREHHRLREAGVLTEAEYEAAKKRILAQHDAAS